MISILARMRNRYLARRKKLRITREAMAAAAGVSLSTIVRAENGKAVSPLAARAIEAAFAEKESEAKGAA